MSTKANFTMRKLVSSALNDFCSFTHPNYNLSMKIGLDIMGGDYAPKKQFMELFLLLSNYQKT